MASQVAKVIADQIFTDLDARRRMAGYELDESMREAMKHEWCQIIDEVLEAASNAGKHD